MNIKYRINRLFTPTNKINHDMIYDYLTADNNIEKKKDPHNILKNQSNMNLLEFSRLYKINKIPFMDFIIVYLFLYSINCICLGYDFEIILLVTLPITLVLEILTNSKLNISLTIFLIVLLSIILLIYKCMNKYNDN
jgi:hypothetical protein